MKSFMKVVEDLIENMPADLRATLDPPPKPKYSCLCCRDTGIVYDPTASDQVREKAGRFCVCRPGRTRWLRTQEILIREGSAEI